MATFRRKPEHRCAAGTQPDGGYHMRLHIGSKQARHISAAEAASLVRSGDWVDYGVTLGQPDVFDKALAARKAELSNVKFRSRISVKPRAVLEADPDGERFFWFSWHFSGYDRKKHDAGIIPTVERIDSPASWPAQAG